MNAFFYQIKQAWLSLKQSPSFIFSIVSTMGITLGALICVLTLAYVMLIKPLPYPDQERLIRVEHQLISNENKIDGRAFTYPNLMHLHNSQEVFSESALSYFDAAVLTSHPVEPMMTISFVTPQWFELFPTTLVKGRLFSESEALNKYNPVAIISYTAWQKEFSGRDNILEEKIEFSGKSYRIIGVTAKESIELSLAGPSFKTQIFVPWDFNPFSEEQRQAWGNDDGALTFIGKLQTDLLENITTESLNQRLTNQINDNWQQHVSHIPFFKDWRINIETSLVKSFIIGDSERSVYLLILSTLGLVIIACANIANLFVSRTAQRQHQLAICAAVGASKSQLFKTIMAEIGIVMLLSIVVAQVFTYIGFNVLAYYLGDLLPRIDELSLNAFSIATSILLLMLLTFIFSYLCRQMINYRALNATLQSSGKGNGVQVSKRMRNTLISSQIATASVLIFINIVLYSDASKLINKPLGYKTDNIISAVLSLGNAEQSARAEQLTALKRALLQLPKVEAVSQAMRPTIFPTSALTEDATTTRYTAGRKDVDNHYFSIIEQKFVEGDNFSAADIKDNNDVMIINELFAKRLAPNGSALGIKFNNGTRVIGVVETINIPGREHARSRFYLPASPTRNMLVIKTKLGQELTRDEFIQTIKSIGPNLSLFSYASLTENKNQMLFASKTTAITTLVLAVLTLLLSALGLYGILSYSSQMRRFEIGTRLAIGAKAKDIVFLVLKDNASAIFIGILISTLILATLYLGFNTSVATYVSVELVLVFIVTLLLILSISGLACYLPLREYINKPAIHSLKGSD